MQTFNLATTRHPGFQSLSLEIVLLIFNIFWDFLDYHDFMPVLQILQGLVSFAMTCKLALGAATLVAFDEPDQPFGEIIGSKMQPCLLKLCDSCGGYWLRRLLVAERKAHRSISVDNGERRSASLVSYISSLPLCRYLGLGLY